MVDQQYLFFVTFPPLKSGHGSKAMRSASRSALHTLLFLSLLKTSITISKVAATINEATYSLALYCKRAAKSLLRSRSYA